MTVTRKCTEFDSFSKSLKAYTRYVTPYAFKFIRKQHELLDKLEVVSQKSITQFKQDKKPATRSHIMPQPLNVTVLSLPNAAAMQTYFQGL